MHILFLVREIGLLSTLALNDQITVYKSLGSHLVGPFGSRIKHHMATLTSISTSQINSSILDIKKTYLFELFLKSPVLLIISIAISRPRTGWGCRRGGRIARGRGGATFTRGSALWSRACRREGVILRLHMKPLLSLCRYCLDRSLKHYVRSTINPLWYDFQKEVIVRLFYRQIIHCNYPASLILSA